MKDLQEKNKELEKFYETEENSWKNTNEHHARAKKELATQLLTMVTKIMQQLISRLLEILMFLFDLSGIAFIVVLC